MVPTIISFAYCRHPIPTFQGPERPRLKLCLKPSLRYAESKWIGSRLGNPRTFFNFYPKSDKLESLSPKKKGYVHYFAALYHIPSNNLKKSNMIHFLLVKIYNLSLTVLVTRDFFEKCEAEKG